MIALSVITVVLILEAAKFCSKFMTTIGACSATITWNFLFFGKLEEVLDGSWPADVIWFRWRGCVDGLLTDFLAGRFVLHESSSSRSKTRSFRSATSCPWIRVLCWSASGAGTQAGTPLRLGGWDVLTRPASEYALLCYERLRGWGDLPRASSGLPRSLEISSLANFQSSSSTITFTKNSEMILTASS